jgi:hypothetical protein
MEPSMENPVHFVTLCLCKMDFNIIFPSTPSSHWLHILILPWRVRTPWTGNRPTTYTEHTQPDFHALSRIRTHDLSVWAGEGVSCLTPRGHCAQPTSEFKNEVLYSFAYLTCCVSSPSHPRCPYHYTCDGPRCRLPVHSNIPEQTCFINITLSPFLLPWNWSRYIRPKLLKQSIRRVWRHIFVLSIFSVIRYKPVCLKAFISFIRILKILSSRMLCNQVGSHRRFQKNILPPSSGSKCKPNK